ncbi:MAG TPA: hypothetical protein VH518_09225 [Tepidisphaeraceae bacterium]|jgi:hypothetical protein
MNRAAAEGALLEVGCAKENEMNVNSESSAMRNFVPSPFGRGLR